MNNKRQLQRWTTSRPTGVATVARLALTDRERDQLKDNYTHLAFPESVDSDHDSFVAKATGWVFANVPRRILEAVIRWKTDPCSAGVLVIDNVGVDDGLPDTPTDGRRSPDKLTNYSEMVLTGIGSLLGEVFSFRGEREGMLVQDLTPVKGKEHALTNEGASQLGWHTEHSATGYILEPPVNVISYLGFIGLRSDHEGRARTLVADIRDAIELISPEQVGLLRSNSFRVRPPLLVRQTLPPGKQTIDGVPVMTGPETSPEVRVSIYGDLVEPLSAAAAEALEALRRALDAVQRGFTTKPGRMMLVDNRVVLHARAPFEPRFDGQDRWLQRLLVTDSLWPLRAWQRGSKRVLEP